MKLSVDPKLLADLVTSTARALPLGPTVPVLSGLLLEADGDTLTVSAFDYDISARGTAPADIAEPGKLLLPGRLLAEVAKALPTTSFAELAATDTEATIRCGRSDFELRTLPVDDYPTLPEPPATAGTIDADTLAVAIGQVHPAAGRDDTLPMLTGIKLDTDAERLTLAATDRYRIAVTDTTWQPATDASVSALIPGRHLADIAKGLGHGQVSIGLNEHLAAFTTSSTQTTIRLLEEQFIDYRPRVTYDATITATVDAAALAAAVKRVALVADRKTGTGVRLAFTNGEVTVRAGGDDIGRGTEALECALKGDPIEIAFQSQYLLDALGAINGNATIAMVGHSKPALFASADGTHKQLVMSLRLA
ncbi:DNA polymerase III subunit beta [Nonomuraea terrae]|uniref:Beta sliding clamp n=1 Tax=Nonomuraea terrae TaxID=2530383 RepID=A0A4R4YMS7_9ACTN|nr:DNA polymerase III subunit beta [Nonomuraea terrae]TDD45419.1 DNA polymerase III subunit beta [Nonomuraea terrae]